MHETDAEAKVQRWNLAQRIGFRFVFSYAVLYFLTDWVAGLIPFHEVLIGKYNAVWQVVIVWLDRHVLHTGYDFALLDQEGGISNTAFGTILFLCYVALAAFAAALWSVLDRKRAHYQRLYQWFRFLLRFSLALAMIHYGTLKVIPSQMIAPPPPFLLTQRVGDLTPMRLLWLFMGASPAYESFTGLAELLGGILLLLPRTTLLGALICFADMTTVFVLNMSYDVHVKLFSFHLLFMSALLIAPDLRRLADLFIFNRRVEPAEELPLFARKGWNRAPQIFLLLYGLYRAGMGLHTAHQRYAQFHPPEPPLYGVWSVEEFVVDGKTVPPFTEPQSWRWAMFSKPGKLTVERMIGSLQAYALDLDMKGKTMVLADYKEGDHEGKDDLGWRADFSFAEIAEPESDVLLLDGRMDGRSMRVKLRKMPLNDQRFHWIFIPPEEDRVPVQKK
jgi:uncharacterized membrane protein YphA (DoxX/SURF4 family)